MPEPETLKRAAEDKSEGKAASTQAGEFVREEIEHVREGKHGARSTKQAIAIGLSKARRAGVKLPPPKGNGKEAVRQRAKSDSAAAKTVAKTAATGAKPSPTRSRSTLRALRREGHEAASPAALARQAHAAAGRRSAAERSAAAKRAARTKGPAAREAAARKAARTRAR